MNFILCSACKDVGDIFLGGLAATGKQRLITSNTQNNNLTLTPLDNVTKGASWLPLLKITLLSRHLKIDAT